MQELIENRTEVLDALVRESQIQDEKIEAENNPL